MSPGTQFQIPAFRGIEGGAAEIHAIEQIDGGNATSWQLHASLVVQQTKIQLHDTAYLQKVPVCGEHGHSRDVGGRSYPDIVLTHRQTRGAERGTDFRPSSMYSWVGNWNHERFLDQVFE